MDSRFKVRDLINAGLFSLLVVTFFWCGGMVGFIPVLMPVVPFFAALVSAPVFMLYTTKIDKFGMVLILGVVVGLVFFISGHGVYGLPGTLALAFVAELILKKGRYKSVHASRWAYTIFCIFAAFNLLPIYLGREQYVQKLIDMGYGKEFADKILSVLPQWSFLPIVILGCIGGYIGCTLGIKILNKHFRKADMI